MVDVQGNCCVEKYERLPRLREQRADGSYWWYYDRLLDEGVILQS